MTAAKRHSESVLSDLRDAWWSYDYLELIAARLGLARHERVLDVGCGLGHWGLMLLPLFSESAFLEGIDQEPDWIDQATQRAVNLGVSERCRFAEGDAQRLPYGDASFDLVTCQTLLMHLADPDTAIGEMLRVLRPGGRLMVAEPSNLANQFSSDTANRALSPAQIAELANLLVATSRGRAVLGRGDDSIADVLPGMLAARGVEQVQVFQNERPALVTPPYSSDVLAQLDEEMGHSERGFWLWDAKDAKRLYDAGGGESARFAKSYAVFLAHSALFAEQVRSNCYARTGGGHHYIITGLRH